MRQISTGGISFSQLREGNKYYVDKTMLIADILRMDDRGVYLFTRPRRFGKTTNLTMLDAFFNLKYKDEAQKWFSGLEIDHCSDLRRHMNAYPVVNLNLINTDVTSQESFLKRFGEAVYNAYGEHMYLRGSPAVDPRGERIMRALDDDSITTDDLVVSISRLCNMLYRFHGVEPIILIDEYDRAVSNAFGTKSHEPMMDFLGDFLTSTLKENPHRQLAVVTGVMEVAKASSFSGFNNVMVNNIYSSMSDERFGFTESEVRGILDYYGRTDRFPEAKALYDGYHFGDADVFNPFSIMCYVQNDCLPSTYWGDSSSNAVLTELYSKIDSKNLDMLLDLSFGNTVVNPLKKTLTYESISSSAEAILSLMAMSGYLSAVPTSGGYSLKLPNEEVRRMLDDILNEINPIDAYSAR